MAAPKGSGNGTEEHRPGVAVDYRGKSVVDPTVNVQALNEASVKRQDDLRQADRELTDAKLAHLKEVSELTAKFTRELGEVREVHAKELSLAEAGRLNSIRQVDREEVAKSAASQLTAIGTLAAQTTATAETLRTTVATTAAAAETRNSVQYQDTNKRISALELTSSEGKGKQTLADPQMERLTELVAALARSQATGAGQGHGQTQVWGYVVGGLGLIIAIASVAINALR